MYQTKNFGLNITEMPKDKLDTFSFHTDLGYNFESIDNLALSHRNITNCLLEIPQNIKIELINGNIFLKEGSTVYIPSGTGNFNQYDISYDIPNNSFDKNGTKQVMLFFNPGTERLDYYTVGTNIYSGETTPSSTSLYAVWYDTVNNSIKITEDYGANWQDFSFSLPIAIVTITNGSAAKIDQVFNGFGYIGSTVFALPGVKGLIPDGRNEDGSLKNIGFITSNVRIITDANSRANEKLVLSDREIGMRAIYEYQDETNYNYNYATSSLEKTCFIGYISKTATSITEILIKPPFRAVDFNDYHTKITELEAKIESLQTAVKALQG